MWNALCVAFAGVLTGAIVYFTDANVIGKDFKEYADAEDGRMREYPGSARDVKSQIRPRTAIEASNEYLNSSDRASDRGEREATESKRDEGQRDEFAERRQQTRERTQQQLDRRLEQNSQRQEAQRRLENGEKPAENTRVARQAPRSQTTGTARDRMRRNQR